MPLSRTQRATRPVRCLRSTLAMRAWSELALDPLGPLDELLPEVSCRSKVDWTAFGQRTVGHDRLELSANGLRVRCSTN